MSLILDALRKIERDKRRAADGGVSEVVAVSGSRLGARQNWLSLVAIAVGSAVLTAAVFLNSSQPAPSPAETSAVVPADEVDLAEPEPTPLAPLPAPSASRDSAPRSAPPLASATARAMTPPAAPPISDVEDTVVSASDTPAVEESASESSNSDDDGPADPTADDSEGSTEEANEVTQPFRLVGQERVLLDALNIRPPSDAGEVSPSEDALPPEGFPDLVLQGTSVIGGNAVAVISDRRVFVGDRIEGAVVVRIGEREVELEVDGKRFMLRL